ncbi:hypothetical protein CBQ26_10200 [Deinococcus indicus]|uniref:Uncharacterized protein n=1 Tax=Deinococcus indicus TaxID=223556 RepID=A0A246BMH9_9DEIO|nr:hypothetical protein CBQ26_10200 [Deinococcus indicus]
MAARRRGFGRRSPCRHRSPRRHRSPHRPRPVRRLRRGAGGRPVQHAAPGPAPPDPGTDRSDRAAQRRRGDRGRAGQPAAARLVPGDPGPEHPPGRPDGRSASGLRSPPDAGSVTGRPCHGAVDPAGTHCT